MTETIRERIARALQNRRNGAADDWKDCLADAGAILNILSEPGGIVEALKPFAMFALEGKRGGEFIICKGLFSDMKDWDDSPPRECHLHKDDFLRARAAIKAYVSGGEG